MDAVNLVLQLLCGVAGGHAVGAMFPDMKFGTAAVTAAGVAGGLLGSQILTIALGPGSGTSAIIQMIAGSGSGGAIAVIAAGFMYRAMKG